MAPGIAFGDSREIYRNLVGNRSQEATYSWDEAFVDTDDRRELLPLCGDLAGLVGWVGFLGLLVVEPWLVERILGMGAEQFGEMCEDEPHLKHRPSFMRFWRSAEPTGA